MRNYTTKPIKELDKIEFKELLRQKQLIVSIHAMDHLNLKHRKLFKEIELLNICKEQPRKIYLQQNERYAAYFRKKEGYVKIIFSIEQDKAIIVSFMNLREIPK